MGQDEFSLKAQTYLDELDGKLLGIVVLVDNKNKNNNKKTLYENPRVVNVCKSGEDPIKELSD